MNVQIGWFKDQRLIDLLYKEFVNGFVYHNNQKDVVFLFVFLFFFLLPKSWRRCKQMQKNNSHQLFGLSRFCSHRCIFSLSRCFFSASPWLETFDYRVVKGGGSKGRGFPNLP